MAVLPGHRPHTVRGFESRGREGVKVYLGCLWARLRIVATTNDAKGPMRTQGKGDGHKGRYEKVRTILLTAFRGLHPLRSFAFQTLRVARIAKPRRAGAPSSLTLNDQVTGGKHESPERADARLRRRARSMKGVIAAGRSKPLSFVAFVPLRPFALPAPARL